ncbi:MAG: hypothetical protein ACYDC1_03420 [Limisphaerales bacterium]
MRFLEHNLWVSLALLAGLAVLAVGTVLQLGGGMPPMKPLPAGGETPRDYLAASRVQNWFSPENSRQALAPSNSVSAFFTLHFQPPPPPPTRQVRVLYQGTVQPAEGPVVAYLRLDDRLLVLTNGAQVVADHSIRDITRQSVTLTNAANTATNVVEFRKTVTLEVPAN